MTQSIETWFVGSFANIQVGRYEYLWLIVIITLLIFMYANRLTLAGLEKMSQQALALITIELFFWDRSYLCCSWNCCSCYWALTFLGLIVPNIVSMFRGDDLRSNLPWVCVIGMGTITACDIISRTIIKPFELPVSLILATVGAVVFITILLRQRKPRRLR